MRLVNLYIILVLLLPAIAAAFSLDEPLKDPNLEKRAQNLFNEIRCVVCISQPIAESDTDLARDLRNLVRNSIMRGETDEQVKAYLVSKYGEQILLSPPLTQNTALLWITPILLLITGGVILAVLTRKRTKN